MKGPRSPGVFCWDYIFCTIIAAETISDSFSAQTLNPFARTWLEGWMEEWKIRK
jgi:hypothetical protein